MLTNDQLERLSDKMGFKLAGVFFKDELPKKIEYNRGYIINMENSEDDEGKQNDGSHWTCFQVNKYPTGLIEPLYFDSYGQPPPAAVIEFVKRNTGKPLPYCKTDIQNMMSSACGWFCCAFLHFINVFEHRSKDLYRDADYFLGLFYDLSESTEIKGNEFILKQFFVSKDPSKRRAIEVIADPETITGGVEIENEIKYASPTPTCKC